MATQLLDVDPRTVPVSPSRRTGDDLPSITVLDFGRIYAALLEDRLAQ